MMERIASFTVDHDVLTPGLYLSRRDGDVVTFDLRFKKPNTGDLLTNSRCTPWSTSSPRCSATPPPRTRWSISARWAVRPGFFLFDGGN